MPIIFHMIKVLIIVREPFSASPYNLLLADNTDIHRLDEKNPRYKTYGASGMAQLFIVCIK